MAPMVATLPPWYLVTVGVFTSKRLVGPNPGAVCFHRQQSAAKKGETYHQKARYHKSPAATEVNRTDAPAL